MSKEIKFNRVFCSKHPEIDLMGLCEADANRKLSLGITACPQCLSEAEAIGVSKALDHTRKYGLPEAAK